MISMTMNANLTVIVYTMMNSKKLYNKIQKSVQLFSKNMNLIILKLMK